MLLISNFFLVPLYVLHLGKEQYGLWLLVQSIVGYLGFSNLGIAQSVSNLVATKYAQEDYGSIRIIASSGFMLYSCIITVILLILLPCLYFFPMENLFNGSDDLKSIIFPVLTVSSVFFLCKLPLSIFSSTLKSMNLIYKEQMFALLSSVIQIFGVIFVLKSNIGILGLAYVYGATGLILGISLYLYLPTKIKNFRISFRFVDIEVAKMILVPGGYFFLLQLSGALIAGTDNVIISMFMSISDVPPYAIAFQLSMILIGLVSVFTSSMIPSVTIAYSKNNMKYLANLYTRGLQICFALGSLITVLLIMFGPEFIVLWVGETQYMGNMAFYCLVGFVFITIIIWPADALLVGTTNHKIYALAVLFEGIMNLLFSIYLVQLFGLLGVALATFSSRALVSGWALFYLASKIIHVGARTIFLEVISPLIIPILGIFLCAYALDQIGLMGWYRIIFNSTFITLLYFGMIYAIAFSSTDRHKCRKVILSDWFNRLS